jgi:hypothetical protein
VAKHLELAAELLPGQPASAASRGVETSFWMLVMCILAVAGALEMRSALSESLVYDEVFHIPVGYSALVLEDYSWDVEHPPLARMLSAVPLAFMHLDVPPRIAPNGKKQNEISYGTSFIYGNRVSADTIILAARSMIIAVTLIFSAALAWWTRRHFGSIAALLAVTLCAFDPNLMAHGHYVTTDYLLTAFYFFACVLWVEYLVSGRVRDLIVAGVVLALALMTKFSAVLLFPTLAMLFAIGWVQRPREFSLRRLAIATGLVIAILFVVVNLVYWPETLRCLRNQVGPLQNVEAIQQHMGGLQTFLFHHDPLHLFSHSLLRGLLVLKNHATLGHPSCLLEMRSHNGWWYYFPVVFAVKSTIALLALTAILMVFTFWRAASGISGQVIQNFRAIPLRWVGLLLPPTFYFATCLASKIDLGVRHILPIYPFLFVAGAVLLAKAGSHSRVRMIGMILLGTLQIAESATVAPHYLAFFNALSGGPARGPKYVVDSNIDWGQDLKNLAKWLGAHGTHQAYLSYFGTASPAYYGIAATDLPRPGDQKGWKQIDGFVVASVTGFCGTYVPYELLAPLRPREPVAKIGWSLYVYDFRKHP